MIKYLKEIKEYEQTIESKNTESSTLLMPTINQTVESINTGSFSSSKILELKQNVELKDTSSSQMLELSNLKSKKQNFFCQQEIFKVLSILFAKIDQISSINNNDDADTDKVEEEIAVQLSQNNANCLWCGKKSINGRYYIYNVDNIRCIGWGCIEC
jgi:hypothetical protein